MAEKPTNIDTVTRLDRNLALLQAGSIITIDISTPAGQRAKFRTTFIGYLPKKYVLIQFPDAKKLGKFSQHIVQGASITVRGLLEGHEGAVVAFVSSIKQTLQMPSRIMVLDFPKTVGLQNLRSSVRIETYIKAKVKVKDEYWDSVISDISVSGCQLMINNGEKLTLSDDKPVEITIEDFQELKNLKLEAEICNSKVQSDGILLGVKFDDSSKLQVVKLLQQAVISPN